MQLKVDEKEQLDYIKKEIKHVCTKIPPREPGTEGERMGCEYFAEVLKKYNCQTKIESFDEHPGAFFGIFKIYGIGVLITILSMFLFPLVGVIVSSIVLTIVLIQFFLYVPIVDKFFPKKTGTNLTAIRPCKKEVKARILFVGHIDAAWCFRIINRWNGSAFHVASFLAMIGAFLHYALCIAMIATKGVMYSPVINFKPDILFWISISSLIFIPFEAGITFLDNKKIVVEGANDNLTACLNSVAMVRALELQHIQLDHVEVGVVLTGSEEAGLKGAKAWTKAHKDEYKDVPTYIYSFDTIHDPDDLMINYRDLNSLVKMDKEACDAFYTAAKQVGVKAKKGALPPLGGSTDGSAFAKGGFKACSVTSLVHNLGNYYHTVRDNHNNLNDTAIVNCYKTTLKVLENFINKYEK